MLDFQLLVLITQNSAFISFKVFRLLVEVTLEKVYYSKLKFTIVNAGRTQSMKSMIDGNRWHSMTIDAN